MCAWGSNKRGQLGLGAGAPQTVWRPLLLPSLARTSVTQLVCGAHHTLALTAQSQVLAWGANERGQLGVGDTSDRHTPTQVEGLWGLPITRLAAGDCHSLALTNTGQLFAWGSNSHGQCGVIIEEEPETPETPAPPPEPLPSPPRPSPPPQRPEDKLHQAWKEAMANMGIEPDVVELSLSHTGWRGVEVRHSHTHTRARASPAHCIAAYTKAQLWALSAVIACCDCVFHNVVFVCVYVCSWLLNGYLVRTKRTSSAT